MAAVIQLVKDTHKPDPMAYSHDSGNVYAWTKGGKGNHRMRKALLKGLKNANLVNIIMCLEERFSYRGEQFYGYIRHCDAIDKMNVGKVAGEAGYQMSIMEDAGIQDRETFTRQFKHTGVYWLSSNHHFQAKQEKIEFGTTSENFPTGAFLYCAYQNRIKHYTVFIRNTPLANTFFNKIRKDNGIAYKKDKA